MRNFIIIFVSVILLNFIFPTKNFANEFGVNFYGLSYHIITDKRSRDRLNEFNPGIGFRATFGRQNSSNLFLEGGQFRDTFDNSAKYISIGLLLRIVHHFKVGVNASVYSTKSIRGGDTFFAPVPIATYTLGPITANGIFLPKYSDINPYHTLGFYLTIRLIKGSPTKKN